MKLINLNIWGGKIHDKVLEFIKTKASETDIFCLQEIFKSEKEMIISKGAYSNIKREIEEINLVDSELKVYFSPKLIVLSETSAMAALP